MRQGTAGNWLLLVVLVTAMAVWAQGGAPAPMPAPAPAEGTPAPAPATPPAEGTPAPAPAVPAVPDIASPVPAYVAAGTTMAPAVPVFEWLGYSVAFDAAARKLTGQGTFAGEPRTFEVSFLRGTATVDGKPAELVRPAVIRRRTPFVPLRFAAEVTGAKITWDSAARRAVLTQGEKQGALPVPEVLLPDVAFVRGVGAKATLMQYSFETESSVVLTSRTGVSHPSWTPDGQSLVYASAGNLFVLDMQTKRTRVLDKSGNAGTPAVHPGGKACWYTRLFVTKGKPEETRLELWRIGLTEEGGPSMLAVVEKGAATRKAYRLSWRADGAAAVLTVSGPKGLEPVFVNGKGVQAADPNPAVENQARTVDTPVWHPHKPVLAYPRDRRGAEGATDSVLERFDTVAGKGTIWRNAAGPRAFRWPAFAPTGNQLVFIRPDAAKLPLLHFLDLVTKTERTLGGPADQPAWRPR